MWKRTLLTVSLTTVLAGSGPTLAPASADPRPPGPDVVRVDTGLLRGSLAADHTTFTSVPYAAPPVGERRWRPPARPARWQGVRDATGPSPLCPQGFGQTVLGQEDCLYLDVTVPGEVRRGARLPVLVWLHGGGFTSGGAQAYGAVRLATRGGLLVVSPNYRLGALGFLGGNYGLMDQVAALRWVRRNIARFGGDPRNVTLAGQSAGARSTCAHLASPRSRGLFHRAVVQSGACDNKVPTRTRARRWAAQATRDLGCAGAADVAGCLRAVPPERLLGVLAGEGRAVTSRVSDRPWNPVAGTAMLPRQPGAALRDGTAARVPLLLGSTHDEMRGFVSQEAPLTDEEYVDMVTDAFGPRADDVLEEYPADGHDTPALALAALLSDWGGSIGACPVLRTARAAATHRPVYAYEFVEATDEVVNGLPLGSFHGMDLPYLFDLDLIYDPYPEPTPAQERLAATMVDYWAAFARSGDPKGGSRADWPEHGASGAVLRLSTVGIVPTPFAGDHRCGFWDDVRH